LDAIRALAAAAMSAIENLGSRARRGSADERPGPKPARTPVPPKPAAPRPAPPATPSPVTLPTEPDTTSSAPEEPVLATGEDANKPRSPWFTPTTRSSSLGERGTILDRRNGFGLLRSDAAETEAEILSPEEQELHDDARRFARLLVSEIKLYNEAKVAAGRQEKDLYQRLRTDIERSRQMYNERVPPSIAARTNYFMDELVSILAEGDRSTLGM